MLEPLLIPSESVDGQTQLAQRCLRVVGFTASRARPLPRRELVLASLQPVDRRICLLEREQLVHPPHGARGYPMRLR